MYNDRNNYHYQNYSNSGIYGNQYSNNSNIPYYYEKYLNFINANTENNKYTNIYTNSLIGKNDKTSEKYNMKDNQKKEINLCKIKNYGNNCYLNSGLQILVSCKIFVEELNKYKTQNKLTYLTKQAIYKLLNEKNYDPEELLMYFSRKNNEFATQSCSQNFIRTLLKNLNDELLLTNENLIVDNEQYTPNSQNENYKYRRFIISNNIFPESSLLSIFSGMTKSHCKSICRYCGELIEEYSFCYFIDQIMYLDNNKFICNFSDILKKNFEKNNLIMNCPNCSREINMDEDTKIIKLPEILIFTLERYQGEFNDVEIKPDEIIDMRNYVDIFGNRTKYELIAINIRLGRQKNFGHEICQVKRKGKWFELNDDIKVEEKKKSYNNYSYGLFYKRL